VQVAVSCKSRFPFSLSNALCVFPLASASRDSHPFLFLSHPRPLFPQPRVPAEIITRGTATSNFHFLSLQIIRMDFPMLKVIKVRFYSSLQSVKPDGILPRLDRPDYSLTMERELLPPSRNRTVAFSFPRFVTYSPLIIF